MKELSAVERERNYKMWKAGWRDGTEGAYDSPAAIENPNYRLGFFRGQRALQSAVQEQQGLRTNEAVVHAAMQAEQMR